MSADEAVNPLSGYIILIFVVLFIISLKVKSIRSSIAIKTCVLMTFWFFMQLIMVSTTGGYNIDVFNEIRQLFIACIALIIGWQTNISCKTLKGIGILFIASVLFMLMMQVFINIGGFQIHQVYLTNAKNSIGGLAATAMIMAVILAFEDNNTTRSKVIFSILTLLVLVCLLTIRARTATLVALMLVVFILTRKLYFKKRSILTPTLYLVLVVLILYLLLPDMAVNYVFDSFTYGYEDNLLANRGERNEMALNFLKDNFLLGNMSGKAYVPWIHNFPLLQLYNFGFIGALPVLSLYVYLAIAVATGLLKYNIFDINNVGFLLLAVSFGISMTEPTYPFGPGTVNIFNFTMFGIALRHNTLIKKSIKT
jgi:hypothetical protein